ncbi:endonuclease MutS2 [Clostridium mediterraneense]|uniref:endonuclease MutS2 n=1 Tax=Clostridium mediterraneense TaxID=1805472 RepID=UPI000833F9E0|nr:endonuclease MutS2 [Clostridium mediterraneense]
MNNKVIVSLEFDKIKKLIEKYAITASAKEKIRELEPYGSHFDVIEHLEETKEALDLLIKKGNPPFEGLYDVKEELVRVQKGGGLGAGALLKIANMLRAARRFSEFISTKDEEEGYRILEDIAMGITPYKNVEDAIFRAIIGEEEISDRASEKLYSIRKSLKEKNSSIRDKVNSIVRSNAQYLQDSLFTMRGDRYVIPVKAEYKSLVPGLVHDQSSTGATLFIEPMNLVNLNNEIKELMLQERAEIQRILEELTSLVYGFISTIKTNFDIIVDLDFIFAKAKYGSSMDGILPSVNTEGRIDLIEARHPLIDRKKVVASNIYLGGEFTSLVITGPNTGGKTVTIKATGLIELMGLSGLLIPAKENSSIAFFKEIFADIGEEQSIEQSLSTFSAHMTNIVKIMEQADKDSFVLFDELGAGTDPTEGAALAIAILENLRNRGARILATTHYSELKAYALRTIGVENASVEFNVETLRPTYRLLIGVPGKSNAFEISRRLGLSDDLISESKKLIDSDSLEFEDLIQSLQDKSIKAEEYARDAEKYKIQAKMMKEKYEEKLARIEEVRENAYAEARRESKAILDDAKEEADNILKNMRELERLGVSSEARRALEKERGKLRDKISTAEQSLQKNLEDNKGEELTEVYPGMEAMLPKINQKVIILSEPDNKGEVQVEAGIMKINVKLKELRKVKETKQEKKIRKREAKLNLKQVSSSVDLRGMDSIEATMVADKYLDDAAIAGLGEVTLVHGKGTGVLRSAIADMLRKHPHVKKHRLGVYGEGGNGVTIVELK